METLKTAKMLYKDDGKGMSQMLPTASILVTSRESVPLTAMQPFSHFSQLSFPPVSNGLQPG